MERVKGIVEVEPDRKRFAAQGEKLVLSGLVEAVK